MFNQLNKILLPLSKGERSEVSGVRKEFKFQIN